MKQYPINKKVLAAFLVAFACISYLLLVMYQNFLSTSSRSREYLVALKVMHSVEDVSNSLQAMENHATKFLVGGNSTYIGFYNEALAKAQRRLNDLKSVSWENPSGKLKTQELELLIGEFDNFYSQLMQSNKSLGSINASHYIKGEIISDKIKSTIHIIEEIGRKDLNNDDLVKRQQARNLVVLFAFLSALVLIFLFVSYLIINRELDIKQKSEQKIKHLAGLVNETNEAIFSMDDKFAISFFNKGAEEIFGYKSQDVVGKNIAEIMQSKVSSNERELIKQLLKEKRYWSGEIVHKNKEEEELILHASLSVITSDKNEVTGYVSVVRNVTASRRAEEKSRNLATLIEQTSDAIISIDRSGKILTWNIGACSMFGYSFNDVSGKNYFNFFQSARGRYSEDKILEALEKTGHWKGEAIHSKKNKEKIWVLTSFTAITNEKGIKTGYVAISQDVTAHKIAEEQLKNFNSLLEMQVKEKTEEITNVFNRISDGFMALDRNLNFVFINNNGAQLMGHKAEDMIGRYIWDVFPEGINNAFFHAYNEALATQKAYTMEDVCAPYDIWYFNSIHPSEQGLSIFFRDITESKMIERALLKSEINYKQLIEHASDGILISDVNGNFTVVNSSVCKLTGYTKEEMLMLNIADLLFAEDLIKNPIAYEDLLNGKVTMRERSLRKKDGTAVDIEVSAKLLPDNHIQAIVRNISDRKKAARQLAESENRMRTIIETDPECIKIIDRNGCLLEMNSSGLQMIEADSIEMVRGHQVIGLVNESHKAAFVQMTKDVFSGQAKQLEFEITGLKGTKRWMETHAVPMPDSENKIMSMLCVTRDITDRKKMEDERFRLISIIEATSDLVVVVKGSDFFPVYINKAGLNLLGFGNEHQIQPDALVTDHLTSESACMVFEEGIPHAQKYGIWSGEINILTRDKHQVAVSTMIHAHKDSNGTPLYFSSVMRDISLVKKHQQEMHNSHEQLRQLTAYLQTIREEERSEIAREIHDELGQKLTGIKMDLHQLLKKSGNADLNFRIKETMAQVDNTVKTVRKIATELRPGIIDDLGLIAALEWQSAEFEQRTGIKCNFTSMAADFTFQKKITTTVFRIFQETLTNVARHSKASEVSVSLNSDGKEIILKISDNGKGFDEKQITGKKTLGILGMKERATMINGSISFSGKSKEGTTVILQAPIETPESKTENQLLST